MKKSLKFLLGFALLASINCQVVVDKLEVMLNQTLEECRIAENATVEDAMILYRDDDLWPETKEGKCLIECFFEEIGVVRMKN